MNERQRKGRQPSIKYEVGRFGGARISVPRSPDIPNAWPLPQSHVTCGIFGITGCGKTTILLDLIPCFHNLAQVMVFSCVKTDVYEALQEYCNEQHIEFGFVDSPEGAVEMIPYMLESKEPGRWSLAIFDDFSSSSTSRTDPFNKVSIECIRKLRNSQVHSVYVCQSYTDMPATARNNVNLLVLFPMGAKGATDRMAQEACALSGMPPSAFHDLYEQVMRERHGCMLITRKTVIMSLPEQLGKKACVLDINDDTRKTYDWIKHHYDDSKGARVDDDEEPPQYTA